MRPEQTMFANPVSMRVCGGTHGGTDKTMRPTSVPRYGGCYLFNFSLYCFYFYERFVMTNYNVQQDDFYVPIPNNERRYESIAKSLSRLEVDESMFIEGATTASSVYVNAKTSAKRLGIKILARTMDGGLRIWRMD